MAERLGMGDLEALKNALRVNLESQYAGATRMKLKRALLDKLDAGHDFPLPPRMVDGEFDGIWRQVEGERERGELDAIDAEKSEEQLKAEYRKIAERRVRLGLVLAEMGRQANVQVTDQELGEAMRQEAMKYGAQAQQIFDLLRRNPNTQARMRAPIFEEKVVDLILGRAQVTDKPATKDELLAEDDMPEGFGGDAPAKKPAAKAAKGKAKADAAPSADALRPRRRRPPRPRPSPPPKPRPPSPSARPRPSPNNAVLSPKPARRLQLALADAICRDRPALTRARVLFGRFLYG